MHNNECVVYEYMTERFHKYLVRFHVRYSQLLIENYMRKKKKKKREENKIYDKICP